MPTPYGLKIVEACEGCERRTKAYFCDLGADAARALDRIKFSTTYPKGALIFVEGQEAHGAHILCAGRVKLSTSSGDARVLITEIAEPGEVLGLSAALSGESYEVSAEAVEPCQITFVRRDALLRFLAAHSDAALQAALQMSRNYRAAFAQVRLLGLSHSAAGKFARFILETSARSGYGQGDEEGDRRLRLTLTHEEIGQLIGASRETVTRLFSEFKSDHLIEVKGSTLFVQDTAALEALASY